MAPRGRRRAEDDDGDDLPVSSLDAGESTPVPQSEDDARQADQRVKEREYSQKLDAWLAETVESYRADWMPWLTKKFGEDTAIRMWRDIEPILKPGKDYRRRERIPYAGRTAKAA